MPLLTFEQAMASINAMMPLRPVSGDDEMAHPVGTGQRRRGTFVARLDARLTGVTGRASSACRN